MAVAAPPIRRRPTVAEQNLRMELSALQDAALEACDYLEPRLSWMEPVAIELGPTVHQVVLGCLGHVGRLRRRASA